MCVDLSYNEGNRKHEKEGLTVIQIIFGKKGSGKTKRILDMANASVKGEDSFYGFLAGILAGNYDISVIYVDAFLKLVKTDAADLVDFFAKLETLVANAGCDMIISFSEDAANVPESIRKYQI